MNFYKQNIKFLITDDYLFFNQILYVWFLVSELSSLESLASATWWTTLESGTHAWCLSTHPAHLSNLFFVNNLSAMSTHIIIIAVLVCNYAEILNQTLQLAKWLSHTSHHIKSLTITVFLQKLSIIRLLTLYNRHRTYNLIKPSHKILILPNLRLILNTIDQKFDFLPQNPHCI